MDGIYVLFIICILICVIRIWQQEEIIRSLTDIQDLIIRMLRDETRERDEEEDTSEG